MSSEIAVAATQPSATEFTAIFYLRDEDAYNFESGVHNGTHDDWLFVVGDEGKRYGLRMSTLVKLYEGARAAGIKLNFRIPPRAANSVADVSRPGAEQPEA